MTNRYLFTSESVAAGHPDKVADQISDGVLDAMLAEDKGARVACEAMVTTGMAIVAGEISTECYVEIPDIVRRTLREIGYTDANMGIDARTCAVLTSIDRQSPDIAQGVNEGSGLDMDQGAGDQGHMFGYATSETRELMPLPIMLAHKLMMELKRVREKKILKFLRPDGKCQVSAEYVDGKPVKVNTVVFAAQHTPDVEHKELKEACIETIIKPVIGKELLDDKTIYHVNATGRFVLGGPHADCGLTGRKIIVDTYGGFGAHGGGAFSGKDPSKVDRSAAYAARHVAKNIVAAGLADKCQVQIAYSIGIAKPISVNVTTYGTGKVEESFIEGLIKKHWDLRPKAIIEYLDLLRPIYRKTAAFGHFGREDEDFTWERTEKAEALKSDAGI
jgi:S-adenosylmethionine synthetase